MEGLFAPGDVVAEPAFEPGDARVSAPREGSEPTGATRRHAPVMLVEALAGLGLEADGRLPADRLLVDGTFGRGGHSAAMLDALDGRGVLHAFDHDPAAEAAARLRFGARSGFVFHRANFAELKAVAERDGFAGRIDGLLLDLGVSSPQLDDAARGFSFAHDGPLDMRMNPDAGESAADWLVRADEAAIADVLFHYGEERNARRIARRIAESRIETPLVRTAQLAALVAAVPGPRSRNIHPATRSFQAIRIHVNGELDALKAVLADAAALLAPGGRLVVISFHSLEDRIVKRFLRETGSTKRDTGKKNKYAEHSRAGSLADEREAAAGALAGTDELTGAAGRLIELARRLPTDAECAVNPRARSAVLRVAERPREVLP